MSKLGKLLFAISGISIVLLFTARFLVGGWIDYFYLPLSVAMFTFIFGLFKERRYFLEFLTMRTTKHGLNMGVLILLAMVLAVAVNYLGVRFDKSFDMTQERINSLSDQSLTAINSLKSDLNVLIFYKTKRLKDVAVDVKNDFAMYQKVSKKIKIRLVNSDFDVELAKKYLANNEIFAAVLEYNGRHAIITPQQNADRPYYLESDITGAILKATREKPLNIYFLTGHGEKDIDQQSIDGLKAFSGLLKADGYVPMKLNLLGGDRLPDTESVVAIVGPKSALTDSELSEIRKFAQDGGRLLIAVDPGEKHQMALLTKSLGIEFANNYVMNEVVGSDDGVVGAVGLEFSRDSEITKKIPAGSLAIFPYASELKRAPDAAQENKYYELIKTHPKSFAYHEPKNYPKNVERAAHTLAMAVEGPKLRAVVFGDSDFLTDYRIGGLAHADVAINSVAYLFGDAANVSIRPKRLVATQLVITGPTKAAISLAGIGLPLLLVTLSGVTWYRRRNL